MPKIPEKKRARTPHGTSAINAQSLESIIRDSVRKEMDAQQFRRHTTDTYTQRLREADTRVTEFIQQAISETTRAYRLSVNFFIGGCVTAFIMLIIGIGMVLVSVINPNLLLIGIILVAVGMLWIISLQNRSPLKNSRFMTNYLAKLNVIFAGYIRQINQVDAIFERLVGNSDEITQPMVEQLLNNLQDATAEAMSAIASVSAELEE